MKTKRRLLGILLSLALVLGLMPGMSLTALAWDGNPYENLKNTTTVVKFDNKDWYLIEDNSTASDAGTVTLLSKECVGASKYGSSNTYSGSTVETFVNTWYTSNISADAQTAVSDNKLFLLTTDQAKATTIDIKKCSQASGALLNEWWLCSPGADGTYAACASGSYGSVYGNGKDVSYTLGVRPALKLDLSKVTFDSSTNTFSLRPDEYAVIYKVVGVTWSDVARQTRRRPFKTDRSLPACLQA